jgi:hypothetical protein
MLRQAAALAVLIAIAVGGSASASTTQEAIFQDVMGLRTDPVGTLATLRSLGVGRLRLLLFWNSVAPDPGSRRRPSFDASDPGAYPAAGWALYDQIIETARGDGIAVDLDITGPAPLWAEGSGEPRGGPPGVWKPSAREYGAFVRAVGTRYSGSYGGLPRVSFFSIWNEPNYGQALAPQATSKNAEVSAASYRGLVDGAWSALRATGHAGDTILFGETAPHGFNRPGNFSGTKPVRFIRALYCVDSAYRPLRGAAAAARGCPRSAAGSRRFRADHPALFGASGVSVHPYAEGIAPNLPTYQCGPNLCANRRTHRSDPDYADLPVLPRLLGVLDHLCSVYGSRTRFPVWSTEYGYQTKPPSRIATTSPSQAAVWLNWAEYESFKQPRIRSYAQYILADIRGSNFASGLEFPDGSHKPAFDAYRMPLFMPITSGRRGRSLEVWGAVRPAHTVAGPQQVRIQFGRPGSSATIRTLTITNPRGYFDVRLSFARTGYVRTSWSYPVGGPTVTSRLVRVTIR